jgi:hypothetical protein
MKHGDARQQNLQSTASHNFAKCEYDKQIYSCDLFTVKVLRPQQIGQPSLERRIYYKRNAERNSYLENEIEVKTYKRSCSSGFLISCICGVDDVTCLMVLT